MIFDANPNRIKTFRDSKPPVAGIPSFRCKECGKTQFVFAGRKKAVGGGWRCAGCAK